MCEYFVCIRAFPPHSCLLPTKVRRRHQSLWNWGSGWLWTTMWVLGTKPRSSARTNSLNCWAISSCQLLAVDLPSHWPSTKHRDSQPLIHLAQTIFHPPTLHLPSRWANGFVSHRDLVTPTPYCFSFCFPSASTSASQKGDQIWEVILSQHYTNSPLGVTSSPLPQTAFSHLRPTQGCPRWHSIIMILCLSLIGEHVLIIPLKTFCIRVSCLHVCMSITWVQYHRGQEKGTGSPGNGIMGVDARNQTGFL